MAHFMYNKARKWLKTSTLEQCKSEPTVTHYGAIARFESSISPPRTDGQALAYCLFFSRSRISVSNCSSFDGAGDAAGFSSSFFLRFVR